MAQARPSVGGGCCGCALIKGRTKVGPEARRSLRTDRSEGALRRSPAVWRLRGPRWGQLETQQQEQRRNQEARSGE